MKLLFTRLYNLVSCFRQTLFIVEKRLLEEVRKSDTLIIVGEAVSIFLMEGSALMVVSLG